MTKNTNTKLQEFKNAVIEKAEILVLETFPETILELNELLETPMFKKRNLSEIYEDLNIPLSEPILIKNHNRNFDENVDKSSSTSTPDPTEKEAIIDKQIENPLHSKITCNSSISKIIDTLKPIVHVLLEDCNLLKMWISYMIPKIEDGNNFGVSVQESTLNEIEMTERGAVSVFNSFSQYFSYHGELISKVIQYPNIDDYRRAVAEYDEKQYVRLTDTLREMRNWYSTLHDLIIKNMDKLKKPRFSNTECLY